MSVHKIQNGRYEVRYREGGRQHSRAFDRKGDADKWEAESRRIRQRGGIVPPRVGGLTLLDLTAEWLHQKQLDQTTFKFYEESFDRYIQPYLGDYPVHLLTAPVVRDWQQRLLSKGTGPASVGKVGTMLKQILDYGLAGEHIARNPAATLKRPEHKRKRGKACSTEQIESMRAWMLDRERIGDAALISILGYVGTRPGEALALQWADVRKGSLSITKSIADGRVKSTKTGEDRVAMLPKAVSKDLARWKLLSPSVKGLVFPRPKDGEPWRKTDWTNWRNRYFRRAVEAAGIEGRFRPYDLRHTCASLMIDAGCPVTEVAAQLGHSPQTCLTTYAHELAGRRMEAASEIDGVIEKTRSA